MEFKDRTQVVYNAFMIYYIIYHKYVRSVVDLFSKMIYLVVRSYSGLARKSIVAF